MTQVAHTPESIAMAIAPTLDAFVLAAKPTLQKVSDEIYERLLYSVQDYLRDNGEWNIGQDIARCRQIEAENRKLREALRAIAEFETYPPMDILTSSERGEQTISDLQDIAVAALAKLDGAA